MDDPDAAPATAPALRARGSLKWTGTDAPIAAWVAESDLGTAPEVTAALERALRDGRTGYLPRAERTAMAEATTRFHADRYGWSVDPSRVLPVADVLEAFRLVVELCSPAGTPVILPTPAYMPFVTAPRAWGRRVIQVPMAVDAGRATLDLDGIDAAFAAGGHLLVLVDPHNPTGRVHTRDELLALAAVVDRHGGRVFADAIHAPLTMPGHRHVPYASLDERTARHTVTATAASKAWDVPGLKCAQVLLSSDDDVARWYPLDHLLTHGASTLGVVAATAAYDTGRDWLDGTLLPRLADNRSVFARTLVDAPVSHRPAEGTYLAWVDARPAGRLPPDLGAWVRRHAGLAVVDGAACGEAGRGHVRVNLAMPTPLVAEAGDRLAACLRALPGSDTTSAPERVSSSG